MTKLQKFPDEIEAAAAHEGLGGDKTDQFLKHHSANLTDADR